MQQARFLEAVAALQRLPEDVHCWCSEPELAQAVAEALIDPDTQVAARQLWERITVELQSCPSCIVAHHQAQVSIVRSPSAAHILRQVWKSGLQSFRESTVTIENKPDRHSDLFKVFR